MTNFNRRAHGAPTVRLADARFPARPPCLDKGNMLLPPCAQVLGKALLKLEFGEPSSPTTPTAIPTEAIAG